MFDVDTKDLQAKIGPVLALKMTRPQILATMQAIGDKTADTLAVHDCGLVRVVVAGVEAHLDKLGNAIRPDEAERIEKEWAASRPKRGRPRKR